MRTNRYYPDYTPPGCDSPRARAQAQLFLCGAVSISDVTAEVLAHRYRLKSTTAAEMLASEQQRRLRNGY